MICIVNNIIRIIKIILSELLNEENFKWLIMQIIEKKNYSILRI